jgi:hypothetical protein
MLKIKPTQMPFTESNFQGACEERVQCTSQLGNFAVCNEGRCGCQLQFHFSPQDGRCIMSVGEKTTLIITIIIIATGTRRYISGTKRRNICKLKLINLKLTVK